jgi:hypothetical protein
MDNGRTEPAATVTSPPVVAALAELTSRLSATDADADFDECDGPIYWPTRDRDQAEFDWPALAAWVDRLRARFPHMTARIPDCWYRHNDLVEALLALRDHERVSYSNTAPASAAVEWHRAFRDMEARWDTWIKRFTCTVPGRGHAAVELDPEEAFAEFVQGDLPHRPTAKT